LRGQYFVTFFVLFFNKWSIGTQIVMSNKQFFFLLLIILKMVAPSESKAQKSAPIAVDDTYKVGYELTRSVSAVNGLLANDTDANGAATMAVQTVPVISPTNGTVTLGVDGSFSYTPNMGFIGTDTFTYRVCDNG
jgi:hypothetical protein